MQYKENMKQGASALYYIQWGISKIIFLLFEEKKEKDAWDILTKESLEKKLQSVQKIFDNLQKKESESTQGFLTRINQIRCHSDNNIDKRIVQKVLRSIPPKYDYVVTATQESKDFSVYTFNELTSSLQVYAEWINGGPL